MYMRIGAVKSLMRCCWWMVSFHQPFILVWCIQHPIRLSEMSNSILQCTLWMFTRDMANSDVHEGYGDLYPRCLRRPLVESYTKSKVTPIMTNLMLPIANVKTVISYRYLYKHVRFNMFLMSVLKLEKV